MRHDVCASASVSPSSTHCVREHIARVVSQSFTPTSSLRVSPSNNQPVIQSITHSLTLPVTEPIRLLGSQSINVSRSAVESIIQPIDQAAIYNFQSVGQSIIQLVSPSICLSVKQPTVSLLRSRSDEQADEPVNPFINHSFIIHSFGQLMSRSGCMIYVGLRHFCSCSVFLMGADLNVGICDFDAKNGVTASHTWIATRKKFVKNLLAFSTGFTGMERPLVHSVSR
jgi:hypothetical protein